MNRWLWLLPPLVLLTIPFALRDRPAVPATDAIPLVIVTPHTETIRREFAQAFSAWQERQNGQRVIIDWRAPGGTADIRRMVDDQFRAALRTWNADRFDAAALRACVDARQSADGSEPRAQARAAFLGSEVGIGIDVFFGGGTFDHQLLADQGYVVDAGLIQEMPEFFRDDIIPAVQGGERFYDARGRWYGVCLGSFGICANPGRLAALGWSGLPAAWDDLGDPRLFGATAMADPSKSGSVNRCFEAMIQAAMARAVGTGPADAERLDQGWRDGFLLIKRIAANSRYVSDGGSRVVRDVGQGDAAAGMAVDFYGRSEAAWTQKISGEKRLVFIQPAGGTTWSADPISLLRGAPQRAAAKAFMRFCLSLEGQRLWSQRPGTPGGPRQTALQRMPIRKDAYAPDGRAWRTHPEVEPYAGAVLAYHQPWTGPYFSLIGTTLRTIVVDVRPELVAAWQAIIAAGGPDAVPEAMAELAWLPYAHHEAAAMRAALSGPAEQVLPLVRSWAVEARRHYREAERLASVAMHNRRSGRP